MPPLVGIAVNVTLFPAQIVLPKSDEMLTVGVTVEVAVTVTMLVEAAHGAFEIVHVKI